MSGFDPEWLALREPADADARSTELLAHLPEPLAKPLTPRELEPPREQEVQPRLEPLVMADLGCGTGSMARWLAARLPDPQHWVLYDSDPALLQIAAGALTADGHTTGAHTTGTPTTRAAPAERSPDRPRTVETRRRDVTSLGASDLAGVDLVTASALLDLLTGEELTQLITACATAGCPALLTLSVTGEVTLSPADPLDADIAAAFNAHQRRTDSGRRLLGPDAVSAAREAADRLGVPARVRSTPWRLGPDQSALIVAWLRGWVRAACQQEPELADRATGYLNRRLAAADAGRLRVVVGHDDLLIGPPDGHSAGARMNSGRPPRVEECDAHPRQP